MDNRIVSPLEALDEARNGSASSRRIAYLHAALEGAGMTILQLKAETQELRAEIQRQTQELSNRAGLIVAIVERVGGTVVLPHVRSGVISTSGSVTSFNTPEALTLTYVEPKVDEATEGAQEPPESAAS